MTMDQFLAALLGSLPMTAVVSFALNRLVRQLDQVTERLRELELRMASTRGRNKRERADDGMEE